MLDIIPIAEEHVVEVSSSIIIETIRFEISAAKTIRRTVLIRRVYERLQINKDKGL